MAGVRAAWEALLVPASMVGLAPSAAAAEAQAEAVWGPTEDTAKWLTESTRTSLWPSWPRLAAQKASPAGRILVARHRPDPCGGPEWRGFSVARGASGGPLTEPWRSPCLDASEAHVARM